LNSSFSTKKLKNQKNENKARFSLTLILIVFISDPKFFFPKRMKFKQSQNFSPNLILNNYQAEG